jgi:small-conductance mechanosensitive channel
MTAPIRVLLALLLLAAAVFVPAGAAVAQGAVTWDLAETGTAAPGERAARWSGPDDMTMVTQAQALAAQFRERLAQRLSAFPQAVSETVETFRFNSPTGDPVYFAWLVPWTFSFLVIGYYLTRWIFAYTIVRPRFQPLIKPDPQGISEKLPILVMRAALGIVGIVLSMITAFLLGAAAFNAPENEAAEKTVVIIFATYAVCYGLSLCWRMIISPYLPQYRIPAIGDAEARRLFLWMAAGAYVAVGAHAYCTWMYELDLSDDVHAIVTSGLTLVSVVVSIATVLVNRRAISGAILNGQPAWRATPPARIAAAIWAPLSVLYFLAAWVEMSYRLIMGIPYGFPPILGVYTILMSMLAVYGIVLYLIEGFFRRRRMRAALAAMSAADVAAHEAAGTMPAALDGQIVPPPARKLESMEDLAARVAGIIAIFAGFWALNQIWRLSDFSLIRSVVDNGTEIAFILLMGYVAYQAARIAIDRKIAEETGSDTPGELGDEGGERGASRLATLLPLLRSAILIMIVVSVAAMVLMRFGVNLGPIVAGAGILGIAVGFGAQYLVRDIFSGIFFLIDDAFRKGEYIDVGDVKGTVEKISIRSFQLRHHLGPLHTIPFGEIKSLTNYSRDWVIMKLPLRVTYDTDVDKVRKLIKRLGQELLEDPVIGNQFLQPLKSQGVIEMQDSAMIIRVKFMTKPGDQWTVRQRVYAEIRALFEREGVKFAHREVTVRVANVDADTLTPRQREAIAGAALQDDAALPEMDFAEAR